VQNIENQPTQGGAEPGEAKQRHGCVTAWLIVMIVIYTLNMGYGLFAGFFKHDPIQMVPQWLLGLLTLICMLNILFAVFIFKWKKWAFWGFLATTFLTMGINYAVYGVRQALVGLFSLVILFITLQIKERGKSGWENLE
jgi:quinol-cytochrome oxidoreductase complex cytochrome b subunit